ncbi:MAG: MoaD/ThiS family protein [Candidatus Aminicenantes bacterium]|nr:MoaD/ThiS family protein [Candidatus Aminicenantes bacterium]
MVVKVKFFSAFREVFGTRERDYVIPDGARARALIEAMADQPERRAALLRGSNLHPHLVLLVGGEALSSRGGLEAELRDGDVLAVFPMLGGG